MHALKIPGVVDVLSDLQLKRRALEGVVGETNATNTANHTALTSVVTANKDSIEYELRAAYTSLWSDATRKAFQLSEVMNQQKLDLDQRIIELQDEYRSDIAAASERLRLLERSLWWKLVASGKKNVLAC